METPTTVHLTELIIISVLIIGAICLSSVIGYIVSQSVQPRWFQALCHRLGYDECTRPPHRRIYDESHPVDLDTQWRSFPKRGGR
jgi:hypothetical protein